MKKFKLGSWIVEPNKSLLTSESGKEVRIEPLNMALLYYFSKSPNEPINREKLIEDVWDNKIVTDHAVYKTINQLRKYLASDGDPQGYIKTIPKKGYSLIAPIEQIIEADPKEAINIQFESSSASWFKKWFYKHPVMHTLGLLFLSGLLTWQFSGAAWWYKISQPGFTNIKRIKTIQGYIEDFNVSRDGNWIIATVYDKADRSDNRALKIINLKTHKVIILRDDKFDYSYAKWSVTGNSLIVAKRSTEVEQLYCNFEILKLNQSKSRILSEERIANCSPSRTFAEYDDIQGEIFFSYSEDSVQPSKLYSYDVNSQQVSILTSPVDAPYGDWSLELSPDLTKLAFVRVYNEDNEIMIYDRESEEISSLFKYASYYMDISWSEDGSEISYQPDKYHVNVFSIEHAATRILLAKDNSIGLSEFSRSEQGIYTLSRIDRQNLYELTRSGINKEFKISNVINNGADNLYPVLANLSYDYVYSSSVSGDRQVWLKKENEEPIKLTNLGGDSLFYVKQFSPDDKSILGIYKGAIASLEIESKEFKIIHSNEGIYYENPFWWPDGKSIGFSYQKDGISDIYRMDLDTKEVNQVTSKGGLIGQVTKDGEFLYFIKLSQAGVWRLRLKNLEEYKILDLANADSAYSFRVSKEYIYFTDTKFDNVGLYMFNINTNELRRIKSGNLSIADISVSEDGTKAIYHKQVLDKTELNYYSPKK